MRYILLLFFPFTLFAANFGDPKLLGLFGQPEASARLSKEPLSRIIKEKSPLPQELSLKIDKESPKKPSQSAQISIGEASHTMLSPSDRKALKNFAIAENLSGALTYAEMNGLPLNAPIPANPKGKLRLKGWAGDFKTGETYSQIWVSYCGQIIAKTKSHLPSPQVAETIHPDLKEAAFETEITFEALPRCGKDELQVFAEDPKGNKLMKLAGSLPLSLSGEEEKLAGYAPLPPATKTYRKITVDLSQGVKPIYACAATSCKVESYLDSFVGDGSFVEVIVKNEKGNWKLIDTGEVSGWIRL